MLLRLKCLRAHPLTPALVPGSTFAVRLDLSGPAIVLPLAPQVLNHIAQALNDGALVEETDPPAPEEVLAFVEARLLTMARSPVADVALPMAVALAG